MADFLGLVLIAIIFVIAMRIGEIVVVGVL